MITEEEILGHLANTVYSKGARKSIIGYMVGAGFHRDHIKFAERRCSAKEKPAATFEDFLEFAESDPTTIYRPFETLGMDDFSTIVCPKWRLLRSNATSDGFMIGDCVKYIPTPDESSTEYVEAIAYGEDEKEYLCLSNGEYVRTCFCVKYKVQGEERRKLIDQLNAVL